MKKMILSLAIAFTTFGAFAAGDENVNQKVLDAFQTEFNSAREVEWTTGADYYKAAFVYNEKHVFAYYNTEGDLLGITRYISPEDLPMNLQISLKKKYSNYWISDLFEVAKSETTFYYITVEDADTKVLLKSTAGNDWSVFKTVKKA